MKGLLTLKELSIEQIQGIITYAEELKHECLVSYNNKKFATLFFENSTRTHYSFISALMNLGIKVIDVNTQGSSIAKGETLYDTIKTFEAIGVDGVIIRHSQDEHFKDLEGINGAELSLNSSGPEI